MNYARALFLRLLVVFSVLAFSTPALATNYVTAQGVQSFSISITGTALTATATINAVGSGAFIIYNGVNPASNGDPQPDFASLSLTNSTTITATRQGQNGANTIIKGMIIDGDTTNLIKSVQQGTISLSAGSGTASISAVTNANTAVHWMGVQTALTSAQTSQFFPRVSLSGTTVTANVAVTGSTPVAAYEIIEFQTGALTANGVQRITATSSTSVTSWTASLTSVSTSAAMSIWGGYTTASTVLTMADDYFSGTLTNGTTFTVNVNTGEAVAKNYNASIPEFVSGVLKSIQRGTTTLTGVTSNTSTITSVSTSNAGADFLGNTATDAGFDYIQAASASALTSATVVTTTKNTSTSNVTSSWEIPEFNAFVAAAAGGDAFWFGTIF